MCLCLQLLLFQSHLFVLCLFLCRSCHGGGLQFLLFVSQETHLTLSPGCCSYLGFVGRASSQSCSAAACSHYMQSTSGKYTTPTVWALVFFYACGSFMPTEINHSNKCVKVALQLGETLQAKSHFLKSGFEKVFGSCWWLLFHIYSENVLFNAQDRRTENEQCNVNAVT